MLEAQRNSGFAAGSKFSYCFEVLTIINTKTAQTQMHFPAFLIFVCSLGSRQRSCRCGSFSLSLPLSFLWDWGAFSASLWLDFCISAGFAVSSSFSVTKASPHLLFPAQGVFPRIHSPFSLFLSNSPPLLSAIPSLLSRPWAATKVFQFSYLMISSLVLFPLCPLHVYQT